MKDLISRSALLADIQTDVEDGGVSGMVGGALKRYVKRAPSVDAVEVVRCKVCKYHNKPPCPMMLSFNWTEDDDFCSYGERKEGAD